MCKGLFNHNTRVLRELWQIVEKINSIEPEFTKLSDQQLKNKTKEFKARLASGETLDDIMCEAFATMREASRRTINRRAYDVQLMGAVVLHRGMVDDQKTGEGKTTVAPLAAYLNALSGHGVHIITVNDYLAQRDRDHTAPAYEALGLTVGALTGRTKDEDRKHQYLCDITYGTNTEFGFDYLRDNMVTSLANKVQREHNYCIIDEIDNVLIDEARTPLIISEPTSEATKLYLRFAQIAKHFEANTDYTTEEKSKLLLFTPAGIKKAEHLLGLTNLYDRANIVSIHQLEEAVKARVFYIRDRDYVIVKNKIVIVDEYTGRLMKGKRYTGGLSQAIEAKEGLKVKGEDRTIASVTVQNYFKLYKKLSGMSGTGIQAAEEFKKTFGLQTVAVPTRKPVIRIDADDYFFVTEAGKFTAVVNEIKRVHKKGQPILVGTKSVKRSEILSKLLKQAGLKHVVLNAKQSSREAEIVAEAGKLGRITIATNMAGRGTDIELGEGVAALGGLHVLGTERHEDRRIDDQLRGRSGRQGDPGSSQFFVSLEDELMQLFAPKSTLLAFKQLKLPPSKPIVHPLLTQAMADAQKRVGGYYLDQRIQVLSYDVVLNSQRLAIYKLRDDIMGSQPNLLIVQMLTRVMGRIIDIYCEDPLKKNWHTAGIYQTLMSIIELSQKDQLRIARAQNKKALLHVLVSIGLTALKSLETLLGKGLYEERISALALAVVDDLWTGHLVVMESLQENAGMEAFAERDPLIFYKEEGYAMFVKLLEEIDTKTVAAVFRQ